VVIGAIIGVGIFFTPSKVAVLTGSGGMALAAWAGAGAIALCGALVFAELGARYQASGAQYQVLRDAYGPCPAFLFVFCNATAIQAGAAGIIAVICARNLMVVTGGDAEDSRGVLVLACGLIIGVIVANVAGVRWGARIQNLTVYAKVATLLALTATAAAWGREPVLGSGGVAGAHSGAAVSGFLAALVPALFSYGGWQHALWISGEVREPRRNLPLAIVGGVSVTVAVYLLANWGYLRLLGSERVGASKALAADAVAVVWPETGRRLIAGAVAVSAFGVLNAQLLSGPRLVYGMARDGRFFRVFGVLSRSGTPAAAIGLIGVMALGLLVAAGDGGVDTLLNGVVFIDGVFFAMTGAALFVLRRIERRRAAGGQGRAEGFRVPWYPLVPLVFVLGDLGVVAGAYLDPTVRRAAYVGVAWIVAAAVVYVLCFRRTARGDRAA
jgi:APA family basic amino acid/polyamine antiporter